MSDAEAVVSLENVTVLYGSNRALSDVTTTFVRGAVGLLGPNGAGKEHDDQVAAWLCRADATADAVLGST
jgi:ABC-type branched-subunit amino acid transport system ATPase component